MRKFAASFAAAAMAISIVAAGPASTTPDGFAAELEVKSGETVTFEGEEATGGTTFVFGSSPECSDAPEDKCDKVLVKTLSTGEASFMFDASYDPADYDVTVYESDADGTIGEEIASSGMFYFPVDESDLGFAPFEAATWEAKQGKYYAVVVYYYLAGGGYTLDVSLA